nr:condensation domain-containing protein [uncultured bacterium]
MSDALKVEGSDHGLKSEALIFDRRLLEEKDYWITRLARGIEDSNLKLDHTRPEDYQGEFDQIEANVTVEVYRKLNQVTGAGPFLVYTTLMTALKVCLSKYTGSSAIVVGSPALRESADTRSSNNVLAIVDDLDESLTFRQLLLNVRQSLLDAYGRQRYPFERIVKDLGLESVDHKCPLFDVSLALTDIHRDMPDVKNDIHLTFTKEAQQLSGRVRFNRNLFERESVERFTEHYLNVLAAALNDTNALISDLQMLTASELHLLLVEFNDTKREYPQGLCTHQLFETQAEQTPDAVAAVLENEHLTYRQLNAQANQLARHIRGLGVGPEVTVGLCVERSMAMLVGLLGILKAGGAYVPLDPVYPGERLAFMAQDARISVLLTQKRLVEKLPGYEARTVCLDADWETIAGESEENPESFVTADNMAYVIYTSGSTGAPKGAVISHRALVDRVFAMIEVFHLKAGDRQSQFVSLGFDVLGEEVFPPLSCGASVLLLRNPVELTPAEVLLKCGEAGVTKINMPASYWHQMVDELTSTEQPIPPSLKLMITGAESPSYRKLIDWLELLRHESGFMNVYGPTEATIVATTFQPPMDVAAINMLRKLPIGRPIPNTQIYLLDRNLHPVPVGVPGELHIGGISLARGYLNRPDLTAEKFIPDPFRGLPGARLYKTGDLACYLPDGNIEFLGRADNQVKIRGFRIELGEIEATLKHHPSVRGAVVTFRENGPRDKHLVAYVIPEEENLATGELRDYLQRLLPEHMVPSAFVILEKFPLTPNGKVDRRALPAPELTRDNLTAHFIAPRTREEEIIAEIWSSVLNVKQIGVDDNFFQIGGHSLLATQAISRMRNVFKVEIPLLSLFETPTIAGLARTIEAAARAGSQLQQPPLIPVPRTAPLPLSFAQQRLWFIDQLEPGNAAYNVPAAVRLRGRLNIPALEQSLSEIARRHEVLRTSFALRDGVPVQIVHEAEPMKLGIIDLGGLEEGERVREAQRLASRESQEGFDLSTGPVWRAKLLRLGAEDHVVLLTMHHIVSDAWSISVLINDIAAIYEAYSEGRESPLEELEIQYGDYAAWQRGWLRGEALEGQLGYWREALAGAPEMLELPTDHSRPAVQSYRGAAESLMLPARLTEGMRQLGESEGVTLFMTMLAAFQTLLSRYTGQEEIVVGTPIAGRNRAEIENLIGFFVNTLVLRSKVSGERGFRELVGQVREVCLGAYAHQDLPFEKLVEELQPSRDLSRQPLFQVMFILQNAPQRSLALPKLTLSPVGAEDETAHFELTLTMNETAEGLEATLEYNTDLFERQSIKRMMGHFHRLLEGIVNDPDQHLSELPLLTEAERRQLLYEWNDTRAPFPSHLCLHHLFEAQVERTPEAPAVAHEDEQLSYGELNARANQLARHLRSLGVGPESLVGILLERSLEMIVSLLGVLKAGAAYVPLDPAYPAERLSFMIEDAGLSLLLTQKHLVDGLVAQQTTLIELAAEAKTLAAQSVENLPRAVAADNLGYAIYTSGSTGRPKGVMVMHRSLVNYVLTVAERLELRAGDRFLQFAPLSFDVSVEEIFTSLLTGATVVLRSEVSSTTNFSQLLEQERVTIFELPTAFWQEWLHELDKVGERLPECVRLVIVGGERAQPERLAMWNRVAGQRVSLIHVYGLTETTVTSLTYQMGRETEEQNSRLPLGHPVANTQVYLLDEAGQPVPIGVSGELHVGGEGLARGYLRRADLTAERFIPNPYSEERGARLYRTGDIGRYLADGSVEFLGRRDEQVKIRGFRIEPGEVEAKLSAHPGVREAVVIALEDAGGDKHLAAYLTSEDADLSASSLRSYLQQQLPEYMVPSVYVFVDELPLTPNGKIDKRGLPAPDPGRAIHDEAFETPQTPVEEMLAGIWAELLKLNRIGINDNFFTLGGHSLLAMRIISRVRQAFHVEIPLRSLFETPTVAGLAHNIELASRSSSPLDLPPLIPVPRTAPLPLSFAQQRLWFLDQLEPGNAAYNVAAAVRLRGLLNIAALEESLKEIGRRHEVLRTRFALDEGVPVQVIDSASTIKMEVIELGAIAEGERSEEVERLARREAGEGFDLAEGPVWRAKLLRLGAEDHVVLLTMHHIVSDAWSSEVLVREVRALYEAYSEGRESPLEELEIQYGDYAAWQRGWLRGEALEGQLSYWREALAGAPEMLELPTDHPRPAVQSYEGASAWLLLPQSLTDGLRRLSQGEGVTQFMTLLAAFQTLLYRYTGQEDIVVGTPIAGRNRAEIENLIGFFVNTLVLRSKVSGERGFRELVGQVREVCLGAYAHQDLPFEKLVEELQPSRDLSRQPLFQVMFVYENNRETVSKQSELSLSSMDIYLGAAKFDLTFHVGETAENLEAAIEYNTDLFDETTIERMLRHFQTLLEGIIANPAQPLSELPLLTEAERQELLYERNNTIAPSPSVACLHHLFEAQAARTPEAIALVYEDEKLSYAELNQKANQLAHYLQSLGVGTDSLVGILLHRSVEMVISLLAVLKSGAAYVPLDPAYPAERLSFA